MCVQCPHSFCLWDPLHLRRPTAMTNAWTMSVVVMLLVKLMSSLSLFLNPISLSFIQQVAVKRLLMMMMMRVMGSGVYPSSQ